MKDIKAIIEEHAADLGEEAKAAILKDVRANYKTVAEFEKKAERIRELEEQSQLISEKASKLEGESAELEALRAELRERDEKEAARKAEAEKTARLEAFRATFDEALAGRKFANGIVAETVFSRAYEACEATVGKNAADAIEELTRDMDGVWVNPQRDPKMMPTLGQVSAAKASGEDNAKKSLAAMLFGGPSN